ncbi:MAG: saccharopine dehydrogenase NADP-binding domain-containing protein [Myxococcales bacterium]|nr:saccharopine dehydrogenase NADP-binding domain-containing protein [Myxococcales bacterium]
MSDTRDYDIVLWGATGYTGRLVASHLLRRAGGLRVALAGRNRPKLDELAAELGKPDVPTLVGVREDRTFVDQLASSARVVCTTVGPYAAYGSDLVEACARLGTDYCDLSGEIQWIRRMIDLHGAKAEESGARIVHSCGFDSIPADLGVLFLQTYSQEHAGGPCDRVRARVKDLSGGLSGGTLASLQGLIDEAWGDPAVRRLLLDPYALNPHGDRSGPDRNEAMTPGHDPDFGWTAPFLMAGANARIVRRSSALLGYPYGRDFQYEEALATGRGLTGLAAATAIAGATGAGLASLALPPLSKLTARFRPKPGEGPSREQREAGRFTYVFLGSQDGTPRVRATVTAEVDPGYAATARMLAESALCLAADSPICKGGSWTPASALGMELVGRLDEVGVLFNAALSD